MYYRNVLISFFKTVQIRYLANKELVKFTLFPEVYNSWVRYTLPILFPPITKQHITEMYNTVLLFFLTKNEKSQTNQ